MTMEGMNYLQFFMDDQVYFFEEDKAFFKETVDQIREQLEQEEEELIEEIIELPESETQNEEIVVTPSVENAPSTQENKDPLKMHTSGIKYYGENKKNILVLLEYSGHDLLKSKEFELLLKIMGAVNLTLHEFAIVNMYHHQDLSFQQLVEKFNPKKLLYFTVGEESDLIEGSFEKYVPGTMGDVSTIISDSLSKLLLDVPKKRALWEALKLGFLN